MPLKHNYLGLILMRKSLESLELYIPGGGGLESRTTQISIFGVLALNWNALDASFCPSLFILV